MRISDWSSDVCSSDLDRCHRRRWRRVCAHRRPRLTTAPRPQGPHRPVWGLNGGPAEPMRCPVTEITRRELDEAVEGQTIASRALQTFAEHPDRVALRWREGDGWGEMTWREYEQQVAVAAAGFQRLGVEPGDRVVLMVRNVPEFHIADLALVFLGDTAVSISTSSEIGRPSARVRECLSV